MYYVIICFRTNHNERQAVMHTDRYRNFKIFKLIQLILLILFGVTFFVYLNMDPLLRNNIYSNRNLLTICVFLWGWLSGYSVQAAGTRASGPEKMNRHLHTYPAKLERSADFYILLRFRRYFLEDGR